MSGESSVECLSAGDLVWVRYSGGFVSGRVEQTDFRSSDHAPLVRLSGSGRLDRFPRSDVTLQEAEPDQEWVTG